MDEPNTAGEAEQIFTYGAPDLKFGPGAADEIGSDLARLRVRRALVFTDPGVAATGWPERIAETIARCGIATEVYAEVHIEPTDRSLNQAAAAARASGPWDAFVAVGGGSTIDTAKAVNLLSTNPGELADYLNQPIGRGRAPSEPLRPLIAVPTTTGTGAESTTVCVLDVLALQLKTGISHARLRPTLAVVDPRLTMSQPPLVTACTGMDILCHALESYTAKPYVEFARKAPEARVPYCGANPVSDMWSERALQLLAGALRPAARDGADVAARTSMALAATFAGMGFGNAGVHIPHANAYPLAGRVRDYRPPGYPADEPLIPHGMAVALTAAEAFRFTFPAAPERHLRAARLLGPGAEPAADPVEQLPAAVLALMRDIGMPNGIAEVGYRAEDVADLAGGALQQQRLLSIAPRPASADDLARIFTGSLRLW